MEDLQEQNAIWIKKFEEIHDELGLKEKLEVKLNLLASENIDLCDFKQQCLKKINELEGLVKKLQASEEIVPELNKKLSEAQQRIAHLSAEKDQLIIKIQEINKNAGNKILELENSLQDSKKIISELSAHLDHASIQLNNHNLVLEDAHHFKTLVSQKETIIHELESKLMLISQHGFTSAGQHHFHNKAEIEQHQSTHKIKELEAKIRSLYMIINEKENELRASQHEKELDDNLLEEKVMSILEQNDRLKKELSVLTEEAKMWRHRFENEQSLHSHRQNEPNQNHKLSNIRHHDDLHKTKEHSKVNIKNK